MKPSRYSLLLAVLVSSSWSWADAADPTSATPKDCRTIDDYKAMVDCFAATASEIDAEVTRIYESLLTALGRDLRRDLLASSQAAWKAYREAYCALESSTAEGGSIQPTIRNMCLVDLTRVRIKELEIQLNCSEGDLGCFGPKRRP